MSRHGAYPGLESPQSNREQKREAERRQRRHWEDYVKPIIGVIAIGGVALYNFPVIRWLTCIVVLLYLLRPLGRKIWSWTQHLRR